MPSAVAHIVTGFTNDTRMPYAYAKLTCGHAGNVVLAVPYGTCTKCGQVVRDDEKLTDPHFPKATIRYICPHCGGSSYSNLWSPNPHDDADRVTKPGDVVDCEACGHFEAAMAKFETLDWSTVSHTRFRPSDSRGSADGYVYVYGRDPKSPTCVGLLFAVEYRPGWVADRVDAVLAKHRGMAPLSPTEAR